MTDPTCVRAGSCGNSNLAESLQNDPRAGPGESFALVLPPSTGKT
ncbi:hypothetical protein BN2476_510054 [Paraburkholderia piptadeniae]|uniref:Uncharacterized protein n=1 Tax=Paraburkholderia piptadeniae TaxID=1701573 RepID=A0A1N7SGM9_9BURK|nr:hypothetical protein BN2476_510054 [Paraburkholderia piptadeniae]